MFNGLSPRPDVSLPRSLRSLVRVFDHFSILCYELAKASPCPDLCNRAPAARLGHFVLFVVNSITLAWVHSRFCSLLEELQHHDPGATGGGNEEVLC